MSAAETPTLADRPSGFVVLTGNPNCGKTTLFNALTGLRAKVGNYAGVTVERKEGRLQDSDEYRPLTVLDLPGTYSLSPKSLDEQISRDVLLQRLPSVPAPEIVVVVVDASNLERNLYYATQVIELGYSTIVALNMIDVAAENGHELDPAGLQEALGVPVISLVASRGEGLPELKKKIREIALQPYRREVASLTFHQLPDAITRELPALANMLGEGGGPRARIAAAEALLLLSDEKTLSAGELHYPSDLIDAVNAARQRIEAAGVDWRSVVIEARYGRVAEIQRAVVNETLGNHETLSDRLDRVLTHKLWGMLIFVALMALMFQSIFSFAKLPMDALQNGLGWFGQIVAGWIPPGALQSLVVSGVIKGVGAVVVFLPQICLLFLFIGLLEDTGYMARAAFLMDRLMSKVGLHGKSFIPMLSSFACAIPGIMATRTIESPKDRLVTILVAPLMSCSARLPVYTLLIAACIPDQTVLGIFKLSGLTMLAMYLLGIIVALLMAWLFKKTLLKGETPMLIMELPPYKRPVPLVLLRHMWDRSKLFLRRAGTVILGINILLWFLATYPKSEAITQRFDSLRVEAARPLFPAVKDSDSLDKAIAGLKQQLAQPGATTNALQADLLAQLGHIDASEVGEKLRYSFAGRAGRAIEPLIQPLGFDWKMGIGIVASFAAREVFVSTMSIVYNVGEGDDEEAATVSLADEMRQQRRPDGTVVYTTLTAVSLMVFYVFALQCVSTVAVVRRETNSWKWPVFQWAYMGALAWVLAFVTYQGGRLLGW